MYHPTLILNADYQPLSYYPLSVCSWEDAIRHVVKGTHTVVAEYDTLIRSPSVTMKQPSVLALKKYCPPTQKVVFTRFNVFLRDKFTCQYCHAKFPNGHGLTFDHVVPRANGGKTTWDNIVGACESCNARKAAAKAVGVWAPLHKPHKPTIFELQDNGRHFPPSFLHETWNDYLYWDTELEP